MRSMSASTKGINENSKKPFQSTEKITTLNPWVVIPWHLPYPLFLVIKIINYFVHYFNPIF